MALLNKDAKKKPLQVRAAAGGQVSSGRPSQRVKGAPCNSACPNGNDARGWLITITQRQVLGLEIPDALDAAFSKLTESNPFPAVMGRVCTAPCESSCNRNGKDGAVAVNATERWLGDWGLARKLPLPRLAIEGARVGKVAVVGAGPAGLSCAYHLARRGHSVTLLEATDQAGGSFRAFSPARLPAAILDAEISRVLELGVELRPSAPVHDLATLDGLRDAFDAVCVAVPPPAEAADGGEAPDVFRARPTAGLPAQSLAEGKRLALAADAMLRGVPLAPTTPVMTVGLDDVKRAAYDAAPRSLPAVGTEAADAAIVALTEEQLLAEAKRCYSCGMCYDCERCFLYCQNSAFEKLSKPTPGHYYKLKLEACNGCKKCFNMCPCGCLDWA